MRVLDAAKINYNEYTYDDTCTVGTEVAALLGQPQERVFKTLVTVAKSGAHYVFMIPVAEELDLKKAAKAVGEKAVSMLKAKDLLPLTGYIHGGCSPIGMKKQFPTYIHSSAASLPAIYISAGVRGLQLKIAPAELIAFVGAIMAEISRRE